MYYYSKNTQNRLCFNYKLLVKVKGIPRYLQAFSQELISAFVAVFECVLRLQVSVKEIKALKSDVEQFVVCSLSRWCQWRWCFEVDDASKNNPANFAFRFLQQRFNDGASGRFKRLKQSVRNRFKRMSKGIQ